VTSPNRVPSIQSRRACTISSWDRPIQFQNVWGLAADQVHVLSQPDRDETLEQVARLAEEAEDTLLIHCAGHGFVDAVSKELDLALPQRRREPADRNRQNPAVWASPTCPPSAPLLVSGSVAAHDRADRG